MKNCTVPKPPSSGDSISIQAVSWNGPSEPTGFAELTSPVVVLAFCTVAAVLPVLGSKLESPL